MSLDFSLILSVFALLIAGVTFYFNFLRHPRAFYLTFIHNNSVGSLPEIALINASKSDIIVTTLTYTFQTSASNVFFAQSLQWIERSSLLLPAGKGLHTRVIFSGKFTKSFAESGILNKDGHFQHKVQLNISWVRNDGAMISRNIHVVDVCLDSLGHLVSMCNFQTNPIDLYKLKEG